MIVMKFGGTSLRDGAAIRKVAALVGRIRDRRPLVVVSAHAGVTDLLEDLARNAVGKDHDLDGIRGKHARILSDLGLDPELCAPLFRELEDLCRGISLVGELSPRSRDAVLSFGERLSARIVAAFFRATGLPAEAVEAKELGMRSSGPFGAGVLLPDDGRIPKRLEGIEGIPIVTGFLAEGPGGATCTLGRNGSDLSAAFLGNVCGAEEIQIWTDVDGVMTADPKLVPSARPIASMSFQEAAELAFYGAEVLHPASLAPAEAKDIPVRVKNTHRPDSPGTLLRREFPEEDIPVRCITHKRRITLVSVESGRMFAQPGFLARLFRVFESHGISVDVVATSEVSVSVTLDTPERLDQAVPDLEALGSVEIERDLGLVCVVGHGIRHRTGVPERVFRPLSSEGVTIRMVSMGALKVNLSLVLDQGDVRTAVSALHREFFETGVGSPAAGAGSAGASLKRTGGR